MKIYRSLSELPPNLGPTIATIGNFDGVHRGHQWVIAEVIARAKSLSHSPPADPTSEASFRPDQRPASPSAAEWKDLSISTSGGSPQSVTSLAISLDPHPARVLGKQTNLRLITPLAEKLDLLAATGIDAALVLPFDLTMSQMTAREFATRILCDSAHAIEIHEGENFRFGHHAHAGIEGEGGLESLGRELGFTVRAYAPRSIRGAAVSSSRIRNLLSDGSVSRARALLGRPFAIVSTPASGRGYGTRYTVPTINLAPYAELLPANGVYITALTVGDVTFDAVTNVGNRPTFGEDSFTVESHILNFHPITLAESTPIRVAFLHRLRPEIRWPNPEALRTQIGLDVARAQRYFRLCHALSTRRRL